MKRTKLILTAVGVLAIVGSAVAFNGKFAARYCIAPSSGACTSEVGATQAGQGSFTWAVLKTPNVPCNQHSCTSQIRLLFNE